MNSDEFSPEDLAALIEGHLSKLPIARQRAHPLLLAAEGVLGKKPLVGRIQVQRVLNSVLAGRVSLSDAQAWAFFVLRGYFPNPGREGPIEPIRIEIDASGEPLIVDALARLEEFGDVVDGQIERSELEDLAASLALPPA